MVSAAVKLVRSTLMRPSLVMRLGLLLLAALFVVVLRFTMPGAMHSIDGLLADLSWRSISNSRQDAVPVIIAIDERSLQEVGAWPWDRSIYMQISDRLREYDVALQAYDVVFPESKPGDTAVAQQLSQNGAIIGQVLFANGEEASRTGELSGAIESLRCAQGVGASSGYLASAVAFTSVNKGHLTPRLDADGAIRSVPALLCADGLVYPSLGLASYMQFLTGSKRLALEAGAGWAEAPSILQIRSDEMGVYTLAVSSEGDVLVDYSLAPSAFAVYSVVDLLAGKIPKALLAGRPVIVGATAFGLGDNVPTPYAGAGQGVEIQARLLHALLTNNTPYIAAGNLAMNLALGVGVSLLLLLATVLGTTRLAAFVFPVAAILLPLALFVLALITLLKFGIMLQISAVLLYSLSAATLFGVAEHRQSNQHRKRLFANLRAYLPGSSVDTMSQSLPKGVVDAQRKKRILLSADLRNFSMFEESHLPEETAALLHLFLTESTTLIEKYGGVVEEFKGDSLIASWDAQIQNPMSIVAVASELHVRITSILSAGLMGSQAPMALGLGIEAGDVLIGSIGSEKRRVHTLLGDTVTRVIRLQEMTAELAEPVLFGAGFVELVGESEFRDLGSFLLPGLQKSRRIYASSNKIQDSWEQLAPHLKVLQGGR